MKASITDDNMLEILYGAEKYILPGLMAQGAAHVLQRIDQTNCLEIYNKTHLLTCPTVNEKCVTIFQANPWKFFKDATFQKLTLTALKKLAGLPVMNCTGSDVKTAVMGWIVANGHCESVDDAKLWAHGFTADNFGVKNYQDLSREGSHVMELEDFQTNTTKVKFYSQRRLAGVGLCTGILASQEYELVKLTISYQSPIRTIIIERSIKQSPNFAIVDVMLENAITVSSGTVSIKVEFETKKLRAVITSSLCTQPQCHDDRDRSTDLFDGNRRRHQRHQYYQQNCKNIWSDDYSMGNFTCLAYLIYNNQVN
jgi:hypothetical protein